MSYAIGVITFVVALLVSVMIHEFGHFATAKAFGMKATRFFVGFGPTLWSTRRGETEYGVKAIPAGGFVKIVGMTPLEEVEPGDEERAFYRQPAPARLVVLVAGSVTHLLIAVFVLFGIFATKGDILREQPRAVVDTVSRCVILDAADANRGCRASDPRAPAFGALRPGDRFLAVNGTPVRSYEQVRTAIAGSPGKPVHLSVQRDGVERTLVLVPAAVKGPSGNTIGRLGFSPVVAAEQVGVLGAVPRTFSTIGDFFVSTVHTIGDLPHQVSVILHGQPRGDGAASVVDIARVSGQVAQADVSIGDRISILLLIVAQVNFFVGLFNMLPLLPLDGGHVAIVLFESARRRVYGWIGRPDPGRVDILKILPVTYAVFAAFVGLSLLLIYAGIVNPISIQ